MKFHNTALNTLSEDVNLLYGKSVKLCCEIGPGRAHYHTTEWWLTLWDCGVHKSDLALYGNRVFRTDLNSYIYICYKTKFRVQM